MTVAQHLYLARYISSDATGGFATVGLGAHDRWLEQRERGPSIPDLGIGIIITSTSWHADLGEGRVVVELLEPSGRISVLNDIDGSTAFGEGTEGAPYRVALAIQHHDVGTNGAGPHQLRVSTTLAGADGHDPATIVSEVVVPVHLPGEQAVAPGAAPPTEAGQHGYL